jgi:hypothetical protein
MRTSDHSLQPLLHIRRRVYQRLKQTLGASIVWEEPCAGIECRPGELEDLLDDSWVSILPFDYHGQSVPEAEPDALDVTKGREVLLELLDVHLNSSVGRLIECRLENGGECLLLALEQVRKRALPLEQLRRQCGLQPAEKAEMK